MGSVKIKIWQKCINSSQELHLSVWSIGEVNERWTDQFYRLAWWFLKIRSFQQCQFNTAKRYVTCLETQAARHTAEVENGILESSNTKKHIQMYAACEKLNKFLRRISRKPEGGSREVSFYRSYRASHWNLVSTLLF